MAKRKTHKEFEKEFYAVAKGEYTLLSEYTLSKEPIRVRHEKCGREYVTRPGNFINQGKRCKSCAFLKDTEMFKKDLLRVYKGLYEVIGEYVNSATPIKVRCLKHSEIIKDTPSQILRGRRLCKLCNAEYLSEVQRKPEYVFDEQLKKRHKDIVRVGEYVNTHTPIRLLCKGCDKEFEPTPNSVLRLSGCPTCQESKGERAIREYLTNKGLNFTPQKRFKGCKLNRELPFDFYVEELNLLIEYDGKQHSEPIEFFGGIKAFKEQVKKDEIKNTYAKDSGKRLLRIPYTVEGREVGKVLDTFIEGGSSENSKEVKR